MTIGPTGPSLGEAAVDIVANLDKLDDSLKSGLTRSVRDANRSVEREMRRSGERAGREFGDGVFRSADGRLRDVRGRFVAEGNRLGGGLGESLTRGFRRAFSARTLNLGGLIRGLRLGPVALSGAAALPLLAASIEPVIAGLVAATAAAVQLSGALALIPAGIAGIGAVAATLTVGLGGLDDAFDALAKGKLDKFNEAVKKLAPSARAFAREVQRLGPAWRQLRREVQQNLFRDLDITLRRLAAGGLPTLRAGLAGIATQLSQLAQTSVNQVLDPQVLGNAATVFENVRRTLSELAPAIGPVVRAFATLAAVGSGAFPRIARSVADLAARFETLVSRAAASGELQKFIDGALSGFASLGRTVGNVVRIIAGIAKAGAGAGAGLFTFLENVTDKLADFINSVRGQEAIGNVLDTVAVRGKAVGEALQPIADQLPAVTKALKDLSAVTVPLVAPLGALAGALLGVLAPVVSALATALQPVGEFLGVVGASLASLLEAAEPLAEPILRLGEAMGNLIRQALRPASEVVPVLVAQIKPMIPVFGEWVTAITDTVTAITPLVKQLAELGAIGGPIVLPILLGLAGILIKVSIASFQAFTWIANFVTRLGGIPAIVTGPVNALITIGTAIGAAALAVGRAGVAIYNFINTMASRVNRTLAGWHGQVIGFISRAWSGARDRVSTITGQIVSRVVTFASNVISSIGRGLSGVGAAIARPFSSAVDDVAGALRKIRDTVSTWLGRIQGLIDRIKTAISNIPTPRFPSLPNIPGFAGGGIIERETLIRAGERNRREAILPIKLPSRAISIIRSDAELSAIAAAATGGRSGGRTVEIHAPVTIQNHGGTLDADSVADLFEQRVLGRVL